MPCMCGAVDCPACSGPFFPEAQEDGRECEECGEAGDDVSDYYRFSSVPVAPTHLCTSCARDKAEAAQESMLSDYYGGDSPTEAMAEQEARRLK